MGVSILLINCARPPAPQATIEQSPVQGHLLLSSTKTEVVIPIAPPPADKPLALRIESYEPVFLEPLSDSSAHEAINRAIVINDDILFSDEWLLTLIEQEPPVTKSSFSSPVIQVTTETTLPQILVILPFSHPQYADIANQIKNGIIKSYWQNGYISRIEFVDSHRNFQNLDRIYQQSINQGFNIVMGPLLPRSVERVRFQRQIINLPFNRSESVQLPSSRNISIDLRSNDQWRQLADHAEDLGSCSAILLVDANSQDLNETNNLISEWFKRGKLVKDVIFLSDDVNENNRILTNALQSQSTIEQVSYIDGQYFQKWGAEKDDFPFLRQDVDVIFSMLNLRQTQSLMPVMKLVDGIPIKVLASSQLTLSSEFNPAFDEDLKGIEYLDISWRYQNSGLTLFEAIGQDALLVSLHLISNQNFNYQGLTGTYNYDGNRIIKTLNWHVPFAGQTVFN